MEGAKAKVFIHSDQTLEQTAETLGKLLSLPPFWLKSDMDPPHSITAMTECLGHELWLRESSREGKDGFELEMETSMAPHEHFTADFSDLSEWLTAHLKIVSDWQCASMIPYGMGAAE